MIWKRITIRWQSSFQLFGAGIALWRGNVRIHNDLNSVKNDIADLRERMARLLGMQIEHQRQRNRFTRVSRR